MTAPAKTHPPLRRARLSTQALAEAFASYAREGIAPDLRSDAFGLGLARVSEIARSAGITRALHSAQEKSDSVLEHATEDDSVSASWLESPQPVVTLEADVVSLKRVPAGTPVSYGYEYRTDKETTLALVSMGFADGVPRTASGIGRVSLGGSLHTIAGRIAMDQMVLDIGDASVELGDVATVWGVEPSLNQWSQWSDRPVPLLVSHLASRVVKIWS